MKKHTIRLLNNYIIIGTIAIMALSSCSATRGTASKDEIKTLSNKFGVELTKKDNIKLYSVINSWLGVRYRYGGTTKKGVDCSGFVGAIYSEVYDKKLHRTVADIAAEDCSKIKQGNLKEGDLVFFRTDKKLSKKKSNHVGIYLKDGKFAHASTSKGVEINSLNTNYYKENFVSGGRVK